MAKSQISSLWGWMSKSDRRDSDLEMQKLPIMPGALPFSYLAGLFQTLTSCAKIRFLNYKDLPFEFNRQVHSEDDLRKLYKDEYSSWKENSLKEPTLDILFLHDCDSGPAQTVYLCEKEARYGIRSTTSLFVNILDSNGNPMPYKIDFLALRKLQEKGICFTYHANAGELAGYDEEKVRSVCNADVTWLENHGFDIQFFSPHGGRPSSDGRNNNSFFYPALFNRSLIWTHNRFAPSGHRYSDGGFIPRLQKGTPGTDLRAYLIENLALSRRIFILIHPQYYFADAPNPSVMASEDVPEWLLEYWRLCESGKEIQYWAPLADRLSQL